MNAASATTTAINQGLKPGVHARGGAAPPAMEGAGELGVELAEGVPFSGIMSLLVIDVRQGHLVQEF